MAKIEPCYKQIGLRIKIAREAAGLTQRHVADLMGLSRPSIVNIETGAQRIMLHHLYELAAILNVNVEEFLIDKGLSKTAKDYEKLRERLKSRLVDELNRVKDQFDNQIVKLKREL